jgi:hypothetical protein
VSALILSVLGFIEAELSGPMETAKTAAWRADKSVLIRIVPTYRLYSEKVQRCKKTPPNTAGLHVLDRMLDRQISFFTVCSSALED